MGQQVDIFGILLPRSTPIFRDSLSPIGQHRKPHSENFLRETEKILKPIPLTAARKPASVQEHKSYSYAVWDDGDFL